MPSGFRQVATPGVHAMLADQVGPAGLATFRLQVGIDLRCQRGDILSVIEDGNPAIGLVGRNPLKPFEHLKASDSNPSDRSKVVRQECSPNAVRMENRTSTMPSGQAMQERFRATLGLAFDDRLTLVIDHHEIVGAQVPFVFPAGGDDQSQRVSFGDNAVVAGGSERPAASPQLVTDAAQPLDLVGEVI